LTQRSGVCSVSCLGFDLERVDTEVECLQSLLLQRDTHSSPDTSCVLITNMHVQHCVC